MLETSNAVLEMPTSLGWFPRGIHQEEEEAQIFAQAQLALGERMYLERIDEGTLVAQIEQVEAKMRRTRALPVARQMLKSQRENLLRQLADAALEDDAPLPGAEKEYRRARRAQPLD